MNDEQTKALGMLAKTLPGVSWQPRMMNGRLGETLHRMKGCRVIWTDRVDPMDGFGDLDWADFDPDDWPDFRDPPTMGWLLHQVREACDFHFEVWLDTSCGWKATCYQGHNYVFTVGDEGGGFTSEIETLIAVLQNAATPRKPHTSKENARCPQ